MIKCPMLRLIHKLGILRYRNARLQEFEPIKSTESAQSGGDDERVQSVANRMSAIGNGDGSTRLAEHEDGSAP
jgi:hypothetical protein